MAENGKGLAVIFDLDGVLVDTGWAHLQSWNDLAEKEDFEHSDEFFYRTFGMPNYRILPMLIPGISDGDIELLSNWKESRYRGIIEHKLSLADEVLVLLDDLRDNGFALAIGSSAPRDNLEMILQRTGLSEYIETYVTKNDITQGKPAPETFLKAAQKLNVSPNRCVVVEDAVQGIEAAIAAGMKVIAITSTRQRKDLADADRIVDSLAELRASDFAELLRS